VNLAKQQATLLDMLWPLLGAAGRLLCAVCLVVAEEGALQVNRFLARTPDARLLALPGSGSACAPVPRLPPAASRVERAGRWPGVLDGFFYALLDKHD